MAHISLSILRKALLATGALTLLSVAAPAAYAASGDHGASKHRHPSAKSDHRRDRRVDHRRDRRDHTRGHRSHHNDHARHRNRHYRHRSDHYRPRRDHYRPRRDYYRPARHYWRHARRHGGYYSPYRSRVGISFHFGSPGYSRYRWAPAAHSFYRPIYGSYSGYKNRTSCRRITVEGWHHGHRELVSVKQCSNPWDGTYIVQGSERVIDCRW